MRIHFGWGQQGAGREQCAWEGTWWRFLKAFGTWRDKVPRVHISALCSHSDFIFPGKNAFPGWITGGCRARVGDVGLTGSLWLELCLRLRWQHLAHGGNVSVWAHGGCCWWLSWYWVVPVGRFCPHATTVAPFQLTCFVCCSDFTSSQLSRCRFLFLKVLTLWRFLVFNEPIFEIKKLFFSEFYLTLIFVLLLIAVTFGL